MFIRKYVFPALAVTGLIVATHTVLTSNQQLAAAPPIAAPAPSPFASQIAGAGIVEAASQNVSIGTPVAGLVAEVAVEPGRAVRRGDVLFRIDDRERRAERALRQAHVESAAVEIARLEALPRAEDLPPLEARLQAARSVLEDAEVQWTLAQNVTDKRAISVEELNRRRFAVDGARAQLALAEAELAKARAGAWAPDLDAARARLASAAAALAQSETELERLVVRAPLDGTCLQVDVRVGEFAESGARRPLVLLGDTTRLHVRVDVDESDAWRFRAGAAARASVRGNAELAVDLQFVRVDPYVLPKRSLTGDTLERIDTRVLQVIYAFDPAQLAVYAGQQMDVFIDAPRNGGAK
ncbi:MAG: efflux RND transporter periplasmic adaptor subunit [Planctomycetes bacterium]|nr:efflux RND transporter periplasmic adaptor subunit [Planctomycetota bacterium]